ncbi:hypothetical protein HJC23_000750 [Cyclotella cryptica]|uniref:Methyltransferase domain-containing protein n=1 Tax=Cyclotella cryptica TaxID=29204 RepID=A0ABD3PYF1_9STRA|eukprot:CCRYP_010129-RA/>CCRYP_010129-RA protein AED:0.02 eAED:0.02 QI:220/1/1/1/1/1/2/316/1096
MWKRVSASLPPKSIPKPHKPSWSPTHHPSSFIIHHPLRRNLHPSPSPCQLQQQTNVNDPADADAATTADPTTNKNHHHHSALQQVLESIEQQSLEADRIRALTHPTPWYTLLHSPSRAAWRSTQDWLSTSLSSSSQAVNPEEGVNPEESEEEEEEGDIIQTKAKNNNVVSPLSQTQFNLIQQSGRTNKQLRRTYGRIVECQKGLAIKRERERRMAANYLSRGNFHGSGSMSRMGEEGGNLNDVRGRQVGSWKEKEGRKMGHSSFVTCDDPFVSMLLSYGNNTTSIRGGGLDFESTSTTTENTTSTRTLNNSTTNMAEINAMYRTKKRSQWIASAATAPSSRSGSGAGGAANDKPIGYGPEQTLTNLQYRFIPNYSIAKRVLLEVQSLLGGVPPPPPPTQQQQAGQSTNENNDCFRPKRILDFGCGVGSSSAAALDVFGVCRDGLDDENNNVVVAAAAAASGDHRGGIEWVHSIDVSQSMRDATESVLKSVLEGVPWGYEKQKQEKTDVDEELENYERILREIKGGVNERSLERQRQRLLKWEQSWEIRKDYRTRLTFGESIVDSSSFYSQLSSSNDPERQERPDLPWQKQLNEQRQKALEKKKNEEEGRTSSSQKGSFDLILCTYTLSELSSVTSTLTAAALLWEKLAPGGVMVFVEPGTPDGFSTLRSVRSMLLECFPPREIRNVRTMEEKRSLKERLDGEESEEERDALRIALEELENGHDDWAEECQVLAPCTHNGICPMSRHQKNHVKTNTRFGKYEMASDTDNSAEMTSPAGRGTDDYTDTNNMDESDDENDHGTEEEEERLMQELVDQGYDREELEEMMRMMASFEEEEDDEEDDASDSDDEFSADYDNNEGDDFFEVDVKARSPSTTAQTDVFGSSFCSFVHNFPGGTTRKKGEKFSYLVVQKRTPSNYLNRKSVVKGEGDDMLNDVDIVDMLAKSVYHVQGLKEELMHMAKLERNRGSTSSNDLYEKSQHVKQLRKILDKAVRIEDEFLESTKDKLGMELLHGDDRRRGWGRLIRAPIKKKGHILLDYCSGGCTGKGGCGSNVDGAHGRITRQKVSRAWSARVAPGCFAAARKARWGGLWPDISERVA